MENALNGACVFAQSGGPTSVINASACGVIQTALASPYITRVLAAEHGITGILNDRLFDMGAESPNEISLLLNTPAAAFGSCRYKMSPPEKDDTDYRRILEIFRKYDVRYFFYIGGNDSMDTCGKIAAYMEKVGYDCRVIGIPKTIDNDLMGTDHCPGYGSAAKYIATSIAEIRRDAGVYEKGTIIVIEIMGRHAGWLAGAASLASLCGDGADLIYLPETDFDLDRFTADVTSVYRERGTCIVAVSEGIHYPDGRFVSDAVKSATDGFGHAQLGGLAATLASLLKERTGAKIRGIELSLLQRCAAHIASQTDIDEAYRAGSSAVESAVSGLSGIMIGFERQVNAGVYSCRTVPVPLDIAANNEKKVPLEWINEYGNGVNQGFIDYAFPLIAGENVRAVENGLPRFSRLRFVPADPVK